MLEDLVTLHRVIKTLLRRLVAASAGAAALVATSASVAVAAPATWADTPVSGLALLVEIVLIPLGIASVIALVVWTFTTAKERASTEVEVHSGDDA